MKFVISSNVSTNIEISANLGKVDYTPIEDLLDVLVSVGVDQGETSHCDYWVGLQLPRCGAAERATHWGDEASGKQQRTENNLAHTKQHLPFSFFMSFQLARGR